MMEKDFIPSSDAVTFGITWLLALVGWAVTLFFFDFFEQLDPFTNCFSTFHIVFFTVRFENLFAFGIESDVERKRLGVFARRSPGSWTQMNHLTL